MQSSNGGIAKNPLNDDLSPQYYVDVTSEVCPMTFVRAKLMMERMGPGETGVICVNVGEPLANVPRSIRDHGHEVLSVAPRAGGDRTGPHLIRFRIKG